MIAYDHRGVGALAAGRAPFTIADLADDAAGAARRARLDSAHVLGISMGGMVAQELALNHPERIRTLTLGCTYCRRRGRAADAAVAQKLAEAMLRGDRDRAIATATRSTCRRLRAPTSRPTARFTRWPRRCPRPCR